MDREAATIARHWPATGRPNTDRTADRPTPRTIEIFGWHAS